MLDNKMQQQEQLERKRSAEVIRKRSAKLDVGHSVEQSNIWTFDG